MAQEINFLLLKQTLLWRTDHIQTVGNTRAHRGPSDWLKRRSRAALPCQSSWSCGQRGTEVWGRLAQDWSRLVFSPCPCSTTMGAVAVSQDSTHVRITFLFSSSLFPTLVRSTISLLSPYFPFPSHFLVVPYSRALASHRGHGDRSHTAEARWSGSPFPDRPPRGALRPVHVTRPFVDTVLGVAGPFLFHFCMLNSTDLLSSEDSRSTSLDALLPYFSFQTRARVQRPAAASNPEGEGS